MKVILLKKVKGVGEAGVVVDVSDGYARNFLLPHGYAQIATTEAVKLVQEAEKKVQTKAERELKQAQHLASQLDGQEIEIRVSTSPQGKLFAGLKATDIIKAINEKYKLDLSARVLTLPAQIKEIGETLVKLHLEHGLEAVMTVRVAAR